MAICDISMLRYMVVWDYFQSTMSYTDWLDYCEELVRMFSQYDSVVWDCHSFRFTVRFTELDWVAVDMLQAPGQRYHVTANDYFLLTGDDRIRLTKDEFVSDICERV